MDTLKHMLDALPWTPLPFPAPSRDESIPYATHEAVLVLGEFQFRCYQLSDGQRVFSADDVEAFFRGSES